MSSTPSFGVNGRFLTQPVTGVQRYARNVVAAINAALSDLGAHAPIIAPPSAADPGFSAMPLISAGPHGRLLNLYNTAPAMKADQGVRIHDANVFVTPESYGPAFRAVYGTLQRHLARRAARIATVSTDSARQIARYLPVRAADIAVLSNGHEHALAWHPALANIGPSVIAGASERSDHGFVLALGSRARHKSLQLLLDAAPEIAAMGLDVVVAGGALASSLRKDGRYAGRVRLAVAPDRSAESLCGFVESAVAPETLVVTDDWGGYTGLRKRGCNHHAIAECGDPEVAEDFLPIIHLVFANLKTWLIGIHHGVSTQHLQAYLNEFRFNRRFYPFNALRSLLGMAGGAEAPTFTELYSGDWAHPTCSVSALTG